MEGYILISFASAPTPLNHVTTKSVRLMTTVYLRCQTTDLWIVNFTSTVPAHSEDEHDAEEFRKEFGDEPQPNGFRYVLVVVFKTPCISVFSQGIEEEHIELRDGSQFSNVKPKILTGRKLPTLRISCGYKQAFEQFSMAVRDKYPEMSVEGSNYPPVKWKEYLAHTINILKIAAIAIVITGRNPFASFGMGEPAILQWAQSNKSDLSQNLVHLDFCLYDAIPSNKYGREYAAVNWSF
ncbi:unnamed protein product [Strongylus vulgaris]|uniref:Uncharacterized protein n=1 Tax=Strongylus vulgaris TaxID=40348 RepID=A0A3P7L1H4_STRVU|nr:unnamed protein product [Strongylus vulgaris]